VEVGISSLPRRPAARGPSREVSLDEALRGAVSRDSRAVLAETFLRTSPGRSVAGDVAARRASGSPDPEGDPSWVLAAEGTRVSLSLVLPPAVAGRTSESGGSGPCAGRLEGFEVSFAGDWGTVHRLRSRHPRLVIVWAGLTHKMRATPGSREYSDSRSGGARPGGPLPSGELARVSGP